jgi:DNA-binding beta-propeller fold protein YncE
MTHRSFVLGLAVIGLAACKADTQQQPEPETAYDAVPAAIGSDFWSPFDAAPSPLADMIYFTALTADGAGVFKVAAENGTPQALHVGEPLTAPFGVMPDTANASVFVVDSGSEGIVADDDVDTTTGRIFEISTSGGTPQSLTAAEGTVPKSLDIVSSGGSDRIYFTGRDPQTLAPAVFSMDTNGGSLTTIASGAPLADPSGIAVVSDGTIYVADVAAMNNEAAILRIRNGAVEVFKTGLRVGYPAGIALTLDEKALFVSGLKKDEGTSVVHVIDLATGNVSAFDKNIAQNENSAGVHRAHQSDAFAWADSKGTPNNPGGTVYFIPKR